MPGRFIVCKAGRLAYRPNAKAGCTTVKRVFADLDGIRSEDVHRARFEEVNDEEAISRGYCRFTVIRNPWDRVVSFYFQKMRSPEELKWISRYFEYPRKVRFEEFVEALFSIGVDCFEEHLAPQVERLDVFALDEVVRFEDFESGLRRLLGLGGVEGVKIPWLNKSSHGAFQEYYSPKTREIVGSLYSEDIRELGFSFSG